MNAEIIAVGSELLTPRRVDTNSLFLTGQLNDLGIEVTAKYVVGDDRDRLADMVRRAMIGAEAVILSGGLGPTEDDVTREAVAQALDRRLVFHPAISDEIEQRFRRMGRRMAEVNKRQAMILEGAEVLPNDRGTAPGQWLENNRCFVMLLPGPPGELEPMFTRHCLPRLERRAPKQIIRTQIFRVTGIAESDLDQAIAPIYKQYPDIATTILAHAGDLQVHLRARCGSEAEALAVLADASARIEQILADRIYSRNGDSLETTVGNLLKQKGATLAVAESATGGGLAERITSVAGSSAYFLGGFVTYSRALKTDLLGVPEETLKRFGAVSQEVAQAMATGARWRTGATYALSVTGNAGPTTDGDQAPAGAVYVALADAMDVQVAHRVFTADRTRVRQFSGQMALDLLRRRLQKG